MSLFRRLALVAAVFAPGATPVRAADEAPALWIAESDWGPLASWLTDSDGNERLRAAGPFLEKAEGPRDETHGADAEEMIRKAIRKRDGKGVHRKSHAEQDAVQNK